MSSLCRLCLTESFESIDLSEYREGLPISVLTMIILPVKIYDGEDLNLPQKICSSCLQTVISAYRLRDVSLSSEKVLRSSIDGSDVKVKSEIDDPEMIFVESTCFLPQRRPLKRRSRKKGDQTCEYCEMDFGTTEELNEHINEEHFPVTSEEYTEGLRIDCYKKDKTPKTSKVWRYFGHLYNQDNQHVGAGFHYCNICLTRKIITKYKKTTATSTLIFHLNTIHGISKDGADDDEPEASFVREKYAQRKERVLTTGAAVAATVCSDCGKTFASNQILRKHMKIHSGQFHYCDQCPAKFSYLENLYRHKRCHDPNHLSRYVCDNCGQRFAEMKSLKSHIMRIHLKILPQKKFACDFNGCELRFTTAFNLKKHRITHTDLKPHECQYCANAYASKGDLFKHLQKNHVGDSLYCCEHCPASFRLKVQLREHYKVHYQNVGKEEFQMS